MIAQGMVASSGIVSNGASYQAAEATMAAEGSKEAARHAVDVVMPRVKV